MKINQFARKKRQLNEATEKLERELKLRSEDAIHLIDYLKKKINRLLSELSPFVTKRYLLKSLGALAVLFVLQSNQSIKAQTFVGPTVNPFNIDPGITYFIPAMADMDDDGDIDMLTSDYSDDFGTSFIKYYENIGTANNPNFAAPVNDPFGLTQLFGITIPVFADIDGDGDNDLIMGHENDQTNMIYYENVGTANLAQFGESVDASIGINLPLDEHFVDPEFVDIDDDGDLDLLGGSVLYGEYDSYGALIYYENTGSPSSPQFDTADINPFNFDSDGIDDFVFPTFSDLDLDGDMDLILGAYDGDLRYYENIGSNVAPNFGAPLLNELGLTGTDNFSFPALADFDGDGDADLIVGEYLGNANYYENVMVDGINEIVDDNLLEIYPNPTSEILNFKSEIRIDRIIIHDVIGNQMYQQSGNSALNVRNWTPGIYTVIIEDSNGIVSSQKFVKI
ncbi:MAG: hypothetical protein ACI8XB_002012 [Patiriisocius sp.]|jgi:hypothetical protein